MFMNMIHLTKKKWQIKFTRHVSLIESLLYVEYRPIVSLYKCQIYFYDKYVNYVYMSGLHTYREDFQRHCVRTDLRHSGVTVISMSVSQ